MENIGSRELGTTDPVLENIGKVMETLNCSAYPRGDAEELREPSITSYMHCEPMHQHFKSGVENQRDLIVEVAAHPLFAEMREHAQNRARMAEMVVNLCASYGYIDLATSKRIADFGAGHGSPTLALAQLATRNGGTVDALERGLESVEALRRSGIVDPDRIHDGDGIVYLAEAESAGKYDLITAFMFGPDRDGALAADLLSASANALGEDGRLLVCSERVSIDSLRDTCDQQGVRYEFIGAFPVDDNVNLPDIMVITSAAIQARRPPATLDDIDIKNVFNLVFENIRGLQQE